MVVFLILGPQPGVGGMGIPGQGMYRGNPPRASVQQPNMPRGQPNPSLQQNASRMPMSSMMRLPAAQQAIAAQMAAAQAQQVRKLNYWKNLGG